MVAARKKAWAVVLVVVVAVVVSLLNASTANSIAGPGKSPGAVTQKGVTCNTVPAEELGACVSRMLTDPNGAYSPDHVYTEAEKQPVRAGRQAVGVNAGSWSVVADCTVNDFKLNPVHASVMKSGKVLLTAGSGNFKSLNEQKVFKTWIWDPATPQACPREIPMPADVDLFCSGHSHLTDGRILFFGGTGHYASAELYYTGVRETYAFDEVTEKFTFTGLMSVARWYPNGPVNAAGNPVVTSGLDATGKVTNINETYNPYTGKWTTLPGTRIFPMYAGLVLRKNGTFCYSGANMGGKAGAKPGCWNWTNNAFYPIPGLPYPDCRDQASTLLLYPAQAQKFMIIGGGCPTGVTGTTATVDMNAAAHKFTAGPSLGFSAMHSCATVLPDKSAFVAGGADHNTNPRLQAVRLPAGANAWEQVASPTVGRMYHSTCVLLSNGSVVTMGTTAPGNVVESRFEVYQPWYMQAGVTRPTFTGVSPTLKLGGTHQATFTGPASVTSASLHRLTSVTHSSDPNQRAVDVPVTASGTWGRVNLKIEANPGILPPGVYQLFLRDWRGIPSEAKIVRVVPATATTAAGAGAPASVGVPAAGAPAAAVPAVGPASTGTPSPAAACCCC
ncbi:uncharacterized protein DUF1929 [Kribbella sp. VKM Ac-2527]|uniref:Uncharacterized protein DUF1929 n=1 Tax=Kribbella caucasensis TaxID=2512215 RepID=A0A4R6KBX0_9ACTN|nr:galactose oxidase early set domain-containing protein [Kribbella sp. VKM Ac-2527]TDO45816.1 uncharacterized protein DUF1929 [Kribbella sp. VKM Ac-2527]